MIVVEGVLRGAIIFYLLFWVLNEGGVRQKYNKHWGGGGAGFQKLKGKKSKIIITPPLDKL